ncbi:MAG TPA: stage II sporulation protein M [Steroidobacteraceae bacterium]|nr:stage II sporulation protein M [Steroidobacteraceae bacterium]
MSARGNGGSRERALAASLMKRAPLWRAADERARRLARGRTGDGGDAARMADDYRMLAHDLARVRTLLPDSRAREYLEAAYARAHATLYHGAWRAGSALVTLFRDELPRVVAALAPYIVWSTAIFVLTVAAGYALVDRYPELIALFASPDLIASVEHGRLWTQGLLNVVPSSVLSVQILANNIVVSLIAYCAGFFFGLGTLYILGLNGLMLGAVFAFVGRHGLAGQLAAFIVPHGCVELSVMCLSGAAGAAVGEALIRPGHATRIESFRAAAVSSGKLLAACALLLIGAGLIEGFISPDPRIPLWSRIAIGVGYWLVMLALLSGRLLPRPRAP